MPTKMRLQRKGKKGQPFYHIVIADGRAPRDGKYIEKIGTYNPIAKPAGIDLEFDRALHWLQVGAQPTETVRAILSYKGILFKNHLLKGVAKGALTQEQADAKFDAWLKDKEAKIAGKAQETEQAQKSEIKKRLEAERKVNEARAKEIAAKRLAELKEEMGETEETPEEAVAEAPAEEVKAEAPVEEPKAEEVKAEASVEEPKAEEVKDEAPAEATEEVKEEEKADEEKKAE
ncbi:MAG: 30S ribosomal protein S16 [Bacteroidales bacterium]